MSHVTIECPDCTREHSESWSMGSFCFGQFVCPCGKVIQFRVEVLKSNPFRDSNREESEGADGGRSNG